MREVISRWTGTALCGVGVIATLALAVHGDLTLYIHPRYVVFTVVSTLAGAALLIAAIWVTARDRESHDHDHDHSSAGGPRWRTAVGGAQGVLVVVAAVALLAVPPTILSAERASTSAAATEAGGDAAAPVLVGSDPARFTLRDWVGVLGAGATAADLVGQRADVTGFVLIDDDDPAVARIGRYVITCCAVDAQLFAVPIDRSALPADIATGDWVHVAGSFADVEGVTALTPDTAQEVAEPDDPYLS